MEHLIMAKYSLTPFTEEPSQIEIEFEMNDRVNEYYLSYRVSGELKDLDLDKRSASHTRVLKLWEKTCFEFFIKNERGQYLEFNFSPIFEWNVFYFNKKGDPLLEHPINKAPVLDILNSKDQFLLIAKIDKTIFPQDFFTGELKYSATSVIKKLSGDLNYWAFIHKDSRPNFHHFDSFIGKF
jgi:hypothetical protein